MYFSIYLHVEVETDPHKIWDKLKESYERKNGQNKTFLIKKLINVKYKDDDSMTKHMSVFHNNVNQ